MTLPPIVLLITSPSLRWLAQVSQSDAGFYAHLAISSCAISSGIRSCPSKRLSPFNHDGWVTSEWYRGLLSLQDVYRTRCLDA
ncbi:hypothetical protein EDD16DRAFT_1020169 [Pisolithus croceorrhizus]|nr:hypothetical protein EDD16DRAFT_1020169 [Pisolithus croceorrhizus]